jgi:cytochrome b pre-mRNA-processing protein 3
MPPSAPSLLRRLFGPADPRTRMNALYAAVIAEARRPHWYVDGRVPDTIDGRFDMVVAVLAQALLRLQQLGAPQESAWLTELFVDDMDGQLRQQGIGDVVVGKHVGRMMSALGGRLTAYRAALAGDEDFGEALTRNLYRGDAPDAAALAHVEQALRGLWAKVETRSLGQLCAGELA